MIFAVVPDISHASSALDNLSEAEFDDVSVMMKDEKDRNTIADDKGPLKGCAIGSLKDCLTEYSLNNDQAEKYIKAIENGAVLIAVNTDKDSADSAMEILQDNNAQNIIRI